MFLRINVTPLQTASNVRTSDDGVCGAVMAPGRRREHFRNYVRQGHNSEALPRRSVRPCCSVCSADSTALIGSMQQVRVLRSSDSGIAKSAARQMRCVNKSARVYDVRRTAFLDAHIPFVLLR